MLIDATDSRVKQSPGGMMDYDDDEDDESTPISPGRGDDSKPYSNNMNIPAEHVKQNVSIVC